MKRYTVILTLLSSLGLLDVVAGIYLDTTVGLTETNISSAGYVDGLDYGENMTREFRLMTNYPNHTLVLTVHELVMEQEDKNEICLYDTLTIYDGYNESSPVLKIVCDVKPAGTTYQTTGNVVYVVFQSDNTNNYKGFNIGVRSDGPTTTTSTTSTTTTGTTSVTTSTTTSTTKSTTTPSTTSTSTTPTTATTTTAVGNTNNNSNDDKSDSTTFVIVGSAVGGLLLLILIAVIVICFLKSKKRPQSAVSRDSNPKRVLWSRGGTMVQPFEKQHVPPGEIVQVQTNIFDLELPNGHIKANQLPPISSRIP